MQLPCRRLRRPRRVLRHGPAASCSAAMASRVSVSGVPGDASPGPATTSVAMTVSASIKDSCFVPSCPASRQMVSRSCRPAVSDAPCCPSTSGTSFPIRPRRLTCGNVANPCQPVHLPGPVQNALPFQKRHLDVDDRKLRLPRPCRIPAGCPVARSVEVASDHTAIQRRQNGVSVPLAPSRHQKRMFSSLAAAALLVDLAPRHYRISATAQGAACGGSDGTRVAFLTARSSTGSSDGRSGSPADS